MYGEKEKNNILVPETTINCSPRETAITATPHHNCHNDNEEHSGCNCNPLGNW